MNTPEVLSKLTFDRIYIGNNYSKNITELRKTSISRTMLR